MEGRAYQPRVGAVTRAIVYAMALVAFGASAQPARAQDGDLARAVLNWREDLPEPESLLAGSGWNSRGSGLELAGDIWAQIERLDHQWNYVTGITDPRYPGESRGLSVLQVPPGREVWLNSNGERFINECTSPRDNLPVVLNQPGDSHWVIFDSSGKKYFIVSGSGWTK